jgi:hypothetical protein
MNWKRFRRMRSWPDGGIIPNLLGGTEENSEIPVRIAGVLAEILTKNPLHPSPEG